MPQLVPKVRVGSLLCHYCHWFSVVRLPLWLAASKIRKQSHTGGPKYVGLRMTLWRICPKESFCGLQTVETSIFLAVVIFNHGISTLLGVLDEMSCSYTSHTIKGLGALRSQRLYHSARKSSDSEKRARKHRRAIKKGFLIITLRKTELHMIQGDIRVGFQMCAARFRL